MKTSKELMDECTEAAFKLWAQNEWRKLRDNGPYFEFCGVRYPLFEDNTVPSRGRSKRKGHGRRNAQSVTKE